MTPWMITHCMVEFQSINKAQNSHRNEEKMVKCFNYDLERFHRIKNAHRMDRAVA